LKNPQISQVIIIHPLGADVPCGQKDRQMDVHHTANSCTFCNFVNVPNNADKKLQM